MSNLKKEAETLVHQQQTSEDLNTDDAVAELEATAQNISNKMLVTTLAIVGLIIVVGFLISRSFTTALDKLNNGMTHLAKQDFSHGFDIKLLASIVPGVKDNIEILNSDIEEISSTTEELAAGTE